MRACVIASLLGGLAIASCAGVQACSASLSNDAATPAASPGIQTPLMQPVPSGPAAQHPAPTPAGGADPLDFSDFVPLLSSPALGPAARACGGEDYAACAALVSAHIEKAPLDPLDEPRWHLLLGTLREKAGDSAGALAAYERSSRVAWPLADYAALGVGRSALALGELERAAHELKRIPQTSAVHASALGALAETSCQRGQARACLEQITAFLSAPQMPAGWAGHGFRIAEMLVDQLAVPLTHRAGIDSQLRTLDLLRSLSNRAPGTAARFDVVGMEQKLIAALPSAERAERGRISPADQLARAQALADVGRNGEARAALDSLFSELGSRAKGPIACQARLLRGKVLSRMRLRADAFTECEQLLALCKDQDVRAWALYIAGRAAFQQDRHAETDRMMAQLEGEAPRHRLADDARLYRALAQREMGVEARFSELLDRMPDDYPEGDMTLDGLFRLALSRMERGDWGGAWTVLRRGRDLAAKGLSPGHEGAGRERYFAARALIETGDVERGLGQYEALITELPLSYYMLHAYSRLASISPERARFALEAGLQRALREPFYTAHPPELEDPGFLRVLELLRQSDIDAARRELDFLDLLDSRAPSMLWSMASLYARAGSARHSHAVPRWQLVDWLSRWPAGQWRKAWELAFPRPYSEVVSLEAKRQGIPEALVYAIMREESAFDADAVSPASAYGLMQVISPTARRFGREAGLPHDRRALTTPDVSIAIGTRVLSNYQSRFPSDPLLAIPSYNAGPGRPIRWVKDWPSVDFDLWVELIPYRETRRYTKRVLASRAAYAYLYYPSPGVDPLLLPLRLSSGGSE